MFWHNLFLILCFVLLCFFLIKEDYITFSREKVATNLYNYIFFFTKFLWVTDLFSTICEKGPLYFVLCRNNKTNS